MKRYLRAGDGDKTGVVDRYGFIRYLFYQYEVVVLAVVDYDLIVFR